MYTCKKKKSSQCKDRCKQPVSLIVFCELCELFAHLLKAHSSTTHFAALVIVFLYFFDGEPKLLGDIVYALIDNMYISDSHEGLSSQLGLDRGLGFTMRRRYQKLLTVLKTRNHYLVLALFVPLPLSSSSLDLRLAHCGGSASPILTIQSLASSSISSSAGLRRTEARSTGVPV